MHALATVAPSQPLLRLTNELVGTVIFEPPFYLMILSSLSGSQDLKDRPAKRQLAFYGEYSS
jgi:hypothetical protein